MNCCRDYIAQDTLRVYSAASTVSNCRNNRRNNPGTASHQTKQPSITHVRTGPDKETRQQVQNATKTTASEITLGRKNKTGKANAKSNRQQKKVGEVRGPCGPGSNLCSSPHAMAVAAWPPRKTMLRLSPISLSSSPRFSVSSRPSWPAKFLPKHFTLPSVSRAHLRTEVQTTTFVRKERSSQSANQ